MDDFGSGYSSLNMLKEVKVDRIKLDMRFLTASGDQDMGKKIKTLFRWEYQDVRLTIRSVEEIISISCLHRLS